MTTSFVIDEVATYFNSRGHHRKAIDTGRYLMTSPSVQLIYVDAAIFQESWRRRYFCHCELPVSARPILLMDYEQRKRWRCRVDQAKRIHRGEHRSPILFAHGGSAALDPPYL